MKLPAALRLSPTLAPYTFLSPFVILFAVFGIFPLFFSLYLAFQSWEPTSGLGAMEFVGLGNFAFALQDEWFWKSLKNTTWLAVASGLPQHLVAIPIMDALGWIDQPKALYIPGAASAFGIFLMRQFVASAIPKDLVEAARMDGCSEFGIYARIVLPLLKPALGTLGLITFIASWNNFIGPLIVMRSPDMYTLPLALRSLQSPVNTEWGALMTGSAIATLPLVVLFVLSSRQLISGLTAGAVKRTVRQGSTTPMTILKSVDSINHFPPGFVWGVATSSFQIEGAAMEDGKGLSIWDQFCRVPGAIADASNGDTACDHYNRWAEDIELIASLGVDAYRFSVSWPRVRPGGTGAWNQKGLDFYERLIDRLLERGIKPYLTLNHWDLPAELQATGGWGHRETVYRFVEYAAGMGKRVGDRVAAITTHNEPWVMSVLGHETGVFAPGIKDRAVAMQVSHHLLLSHGLALQALRAQGCAAKLGIVLNLSPIQPATESAADLEKAHLEDGRLVRWYMDPLFKQRYPQDVLDFLGADAPRIEAGDLSAIAAPLDFLGINYYSRSVVSAAEQWKVHDSGYGVTDMGWEIYPRGLTDVLLRLQREYPVPPLYVTENGGAFKDQLVDGHVRDGSAAQPRSCASRSCSGASRRSSRAASVSAWRSAAPSCASPRSSCSTSRCPTSTQRCA